MERGSDYYLKRSSSASDSDDSEVCGSQNNF